ncbi:tonsoku-like protein isoform X2 [Heterodontus francisci]|uniref:tonsoku-like protein isoform X2 n=1 Tax=Heterodontus francisci TaxID=7792 RepID=UPI00355BA932
MSDSHRIHFLQESKRKAQKRNRTQRMAYVCQRLGESYRKNGQFEAAIQEYEQALQLLEKRQDVIGCGDTHRMIGECFLELRNWESSLKHHQGYLELAQSITNYVEEQRAWMLIGRTYLYMHESDQSSETLQEAQKAFVKSMEILDEKLEGTNLYKLPALEVKKMRAGLYLNLGIVWKLMKDDAHSVEYIQRCILIAEQSNLFSDLHRANYILASMHQDDGKYLQALQRLEIAREYAHKAKMESAEVDCFASMGEIHLILGNFLPAKLQLNKAFCLAPPKHCDRDKVKNQLQKAVKGVELQEALSKIPLDNHRWRMRLYEKLGDLCCKVKGYQKGVEYYQKQLVCAEILKRSDEELAVIHFSLGCTFYDLKNYEQAISHYETELKFQKGRSREECKTWLHIAAVKRKEGAERAELDQCYQNALQHAKMAKEPRLQRKVLKALSAMQQNSNSSSEQEDSESEEGTEMEDEMEDAELLKRSDPELSANVSDTTHSASSKCGKTWTTRKEKWKRNHKGESPLHRACIRGNLEQATSLIDRGHPLSFRDNAGWTPLHEACNHGHLDIVRLLLDSGAPLNSADDTLCGGISALHDALSSGQLEIAELLIDRGACLTVRDAEGHSPADCLRLWRQSFKQEPRPDTTQKCVTILNILDTVSLHHEPHINTMTHSDTGPELKPSIQQFQYLHSDLFDTECPPPSPSLVSTDSTLSSYCLTHQERGCIFNGAELPTRSSRVNAQLGQKSTQSKKIQTVDPPKAARPRQGSSNNRWSSEEDDDFMSSPIPYKKQRIQEGQSSSAEQTSTKASSEHTSSNHRSTIIKQREKPKTSSSKSGQSSASTNKSSAESGQSSASTKTYSAKGSQSSASTNISLVKSSQSLSTKTPLAKSSQSSASTNTSLVKSSQSLSTKTPLAKSSQSSASTKTYSAKGSQSSASTNTSLVKSSQSLSTKTPLAKSSQSSASTNTSLVKSSQSLSTKTPLAKSSQSSASTKTYSAKGNQSSASTNTSLVKSSQSLSTKTPLAKSSQSSASTKIPSAKTGQSSASTTLNISSDNLAKCFEIDLLPSFTKTPLKENEWLEFDCSEDDWLEVERSLSKRASSQLAQTVATQVLGETQGSALSPGQTAADILRRKSSDIPTQSDASPSRLQSPKKTTCKIPTSCRMASPSTSQPSIQYTAPSLSSTILPTPIRVRVRVKDRLFLIPVPHSDSDTYSISWLAREAEGRYNQAFGIRPRLSLTSDGALLSQHDPIIHVLHDNEEVLAEVLSWDLPPISESYKRACHSLALAEDPSLSKILQLQENGSSIDLSNLSLTKENLTPILRALKLQTVTRELHLSANRLGDEAMDELLASLVTMPNLTLLDLSSNHITHDGLRKLCDATRLSRDTPFQNLEELNLSLNPLGDSSSQFIASLVRSCPVLSTLKLQACSLTAKFLQHFALSFIMKGSRHLKTLILSHNDLGFKGIQLLLKNLPHDVLSRLEISSVLGNQEDRPFVELIVKYLTQEGCILTHLNLSENSLTDDSISDFARCLPSVPSLAFLDLSQNSGISSSGLETLLAAFAERNSWMEVLDLSV